MAIFVICSALVTAAHAATTTAMADGTVGVYYSQTATVPPPAGGYCPSVYFSYSNWDNGLGVGLAYSDATGCAFTVSGSPQQVGNPSITVDLRDGSNNLIGTYIFTIAIKPFVPTSVALSTSSSAVNYGSPVTLTANLGGTNAGSGTVSFKDGSTTLGTATISGYSASLTTSALTAGTHSLTAVFNGDSTTSAPVTVTVAQATPSLSLGTSSTSATYGNTVTFTGTLSGSGAMTGTVTFKDGAATLGTGTVSGGTASFSMSTLAVGTHAITAVYGGDVNNTSASSSSATVTIAPATPAVTLSASSSSITYGAAVTLSANVSGTGTPSGTVTFKDGATTLGTGTISGGTASFSIASLAVGTHAITAVYGGDVNNSSATSSSATVTVGQATPAVTLSALPSSVTVGTAVTLSANVSGAGTPSGTVTFKDGATTLGTGTISGSTASFSIASLAVGTHAITAFYGGDANNSSVTSSSIPVTVSQVASTVTLSASSSSVAYGTAVTLTATLGGAGTPSGTVTFKDGATTLGTGTVSGGTASFSVSTLAVGTHAITAVYGGDVNNTSATSSSATVTVGQATPVVTLSASPSSVTVGTAVTLSANVSGTGTPGGTVTFKDGATTLGSGTISGGTASFSIASLAVGTHSITAVYGGDANNSSVTSSSIPVTVSQAASTVTLSASSSSVAYGTAVTLTATLGGAGTPSGTVTFKDGATTLGTGTVSGGTASFSISTLAVGTHAITAVYGGDVNNTGATTSPFTVTIGLATPGVTLSASSTSVTVGKAITLSVNVSGAGAPGGTVTFKDGATTLGTGTIAAGTASFSIASLAVGTHAITAVYGGDANNAATSSSSLTVTIAKAAPTVTLSASSSSVTYGTPLTLTANVSGTGNPSGTVTFKDGATTLGTGTISGGVASVTIASLAVGTHHFTAVYGGDVNNISATSSAAATASVGQLSPTVVLRVTASSAPYGTALVLTASINGGSSPDGAVVFSDGATSLGRASVSGSTATLTISTLAIGEHALTATYSGDPINASATSAAASVTIVRASPTIAVSASTASVNEKAPVTFTATLGGGSSPTGTVSFKDGSSVIGTGTISGMSTAFTTSSLSAGSHAISVVYSGDAKNNALTSSAITVVVVSISPAITSISPASGSALGGTRVIISGANLGGVSALSFGGVPAKMVANTANEITAIAPAHAAGAVDVAITAANGTVTGTGAFVYEALPDPARNAAVVALVSAQAEAVRRFSGAHLTNFNQRLETLHGDGWARSSFGLSFNPAAESSNAHNLSAVNGDLFNFGGNGVGAWRRGLRKTGLPTMPTMPAAVGDGGDQLPDLPQKSSAMRQEMAWWIGGALDIGYQKSNGSENDLKLTTSGISFGGDYRFNSKLTLGLGAGYSRSNYMANDASARSVGQGVVAVTYASFRPTPQIFLDAMAGYGELHFDLSRHISGSGTSASGSRGGHQMFGSVTAGREWRSEHWMLSPYGRIDIARASLDSYTESGSGAGALTYFRQAIRNDAASLGLRGELSYRLAFGTLVPQARIAYQHSLQSAGQATMTYGDPALSGPIYAVADTDQDNSQWLSSLGLRLLLKNSIVFSLMYSQSIANSQLGTKSINFNLNGSF